MEKSLDGSITFAKKYLEDLLSFFGLNTVVAATSSDEQVIELNVPSSHLNGFLIGQKGETVRALQFMVSNALRNNEYEVNRVSVDVADYKKQRADRISEQAEAWVKQVVDTKEPIHLKPMNAADRRVIHQLASENYLSSESEGEDRDRHIVLSVKID